MLVILSNHSYKLSKLSTPLLLIHVSPKARKHINYNCYLKSIFHHFSKISQEIVSFNNILTEKVK